MISSGKREEPETKTDEETTLDINTFEVITAKFLRVTNKGYSQRVSKNDPRSQNFA
jgi:hypothetical protein